MGAVYGVAMGGFAALSSRAGVWRQMVSSGVKVPALFFLTLLVTFPSLYVFNALIGSTLTLRALARLMTAAMAVSLAVACLVRDDRGVLLVHHRQLSFHGAA